MFKLNDEEVGDITNFSIIQNKYYIKNAVNTELNGIYKWEQNTFPPKFVQISNANKYYIAYYGNSIWEIRLISNDEYIYETGIGMTGAPCQYESFPRTDSQSGPFTNWDNDTNVQVVETPN